MPAGRRPAGSAEIAVLLGDTKCGKTYLAQHLLAQQTESERAIGLVWTPNVDDPWESCVPMRVGQVRRATWLPRRIVCHHDSYEAIAELAAELGKKFDVVLVVDEAQQVYPERYLDPEELTTQVLHRNRHFNIAFLLCTQVPAKISKRVLDAASRTYLFRIHANRSLLFIKDEYGAAAANDVADLHPRQYIMVTPSERPGHWIRRFREPPGDFEADRSGRARQGPTVKRPEAGESE